MRPQRGYNEARRLLIEQYSQSYTIAHACVKRAVDGPRVQLTMKMVCVHSLDSEGTVI